MVHAGSKCTLKFNAQSVSCSCMVGSNHETIGTSHFDDCDEEALFPHVYTIHCFCLNMRGGYIRIIPDCAWAEPHPLSSSGSTN